MPPPASHVGFETIVFWAALLPIGGMIFQMVCNVCNAEPPSYRRAVAVTALVAAASYVVFDVGGYWVVRLTSDTTHLAFPVNYSYGNWLGEPLVLKWRALSLFPLLGYLPILFAGCLAATLYVMILKEPFRVCIAILAIQWTLNVMAMAGLMYVLSSLGFGSHGQEASPNATGMSARGPYRWQPPRRPPPGRQEPSPANGSATGLEASLHKLLDEEQPALRPFREHLHAFDHYLEPLETASAPYTQHLPPTVQEFLGEGGWWLVLAGLAVAVAFWLRALGRRVRRVLRRSRRARKRRSHDDPMARLAIDLDQIGDALTDPGPNQVTVRGQSGRLRLVVLASSPSYVGELFPEMADSLVDWLQPGLGAILDYDTPRRVVWPRHRSLEHFRQTFKQLVRIPEVEGRRTPWVMISGSAHLGRQTVFVGLAVFLDKTTLYREIQVNREAWNDVLGMAVSEPV